MQPLMEAGLDSIGAVELRNAVSAKFGVELSATVTFDYPTVQALAQYLAAQVAPAPGQFAAGTVTQSMQALPDTHAMEEDITQVRAFQAPSLSVPDNLSMGLNTHESWLTLH